MVPLLHMLTVFVGTGDNVETLLYRRAGGTEVEYERATDTVTSSCPGCRTPTSRV